MLEALQAPRGLTGRLEGGAAGFGLQWDSPLSGHGSVCTMCSEAGREQLQQ